MKINKLILVPTGITTSRIVLSFIFLYLLINNMKIEAIGVFLIAAITDAFDGYSARKLGVASNYGAYFDIIADFILVLVAFLTFIIIGIFPYWLLLLIILVFLQFVLTSKLNVLVYDPVGKYYGAFLFAVILVTLISPPTFYSILLITTVLFTIISLISRYLFFIFRKTAEK
ncbi:CDP-alcohol phosphatidyltransferase family protein [Methanobacterium sp.]|uniref:CDP-alcohol phosphatidyltransferase family protein n=1 Tax=Methanobacterium sp. TaxID=2164 RepID=UPI003C70FB8B